MPEKLKRQTPKEMLLPPGSAPEESIRLRAGLIRGIAFYGSLAILLVAPIRYSVSTDMTTFMVMAAIGLAGLGSAYFLSRKEWLQTAAAIIVVTMIAIIFTGALLIGGLSTPVLMLSPLLPLIATLLGGIRVGWFSTVLATLLISLILYLGNNGLAPQTVDMPIDKLNLMQAATLSVTCCFATAIVWQYERLQLQMQILASHDSLTGIANRGYLDLRLDRECRRASRDNQCLSVILFDIDYFKRYNDHFGHQEGDRCLKQVCSTISEHCRRASDFLARYGGEEFAVIVPDMNQTQALAFANDLRTAVENLQIEHPKSEIGVVTMSGGVVTAFGHHLASANQLLRGADDALYLAKDKGRNNIQTTAYDDTNLDSPVAA